MHSRSSDASPNESTRANPRPLRSRASQPTRPPSAPGSNFFDSDERPLRFLSVDAGYDPQNFVAKLAAATNLSSLRNLEYGEGVGVGFEDLDRACFEDHASLIASPNFALSSVVLRNPNLSLTELRQLAKLRPSLQLQVVDSQARYVEGD